MFGAIGPWLRRRAENISVAMLAIMFVALIAQVVFRYFINMPMGWTDETSLIAWTWLVLWGAAFVVREADEIRFDLLETGDRVTSAYKIEVVDGPAPFDLRLTIADDPRGPKTYFGMRSETDPHGLLLEARLAARR